jgi:hypothetical protein
MISVHKKIITRLAWHHGYGDDSAEGKVILSIKGALSGSIND